MPKKPTTTSQKTIVTLNHPEASRKNIPTAEYESVLQQEQQSPLRVAYERRNKDLDPQLVWRGKDEQDWSDLVVPAPPLFIQEKVQPKVLIDDLRRQSEAARIAREILDRAISGVGIGPQIDLFADFNGLPDTDAKTEFYQHDQHWSNRMILGDSLQVMASLAEREGLRGQVQCIYIDPPYGIKFNSNFQWSTTSRDVKDGDLKQMSREPEQVKAFRDTWRDGIHSYLTYLRDRLSVAHDLLAESGSVFVQIGDANVHRVRALMDEVFGEDNFLSDIVFTTTGGFETGKLANIADHVLWYGRLAEHAKFRQLWEAFTQARQDTAYRWIKEAPGVTRSLKSNESLTAIQGREDVRPFKPDNLISQGAATEAQPFDVGGKTFRPAANSHWKARFPYGMLRLLRGDRIYAAENSLRYIREIGDFPVKARANVWDDTATGQFTDTKIYVVQTNVKIVERCLLMATDPGDLVLDPTCGSGTTAYVAEQWGRRWITIDTSRVALALARARIMGARYPYYLLADSRDGQLKEAEVTRAAPSTAPVHNTLRQGFVYERVPHITLKSIANNAEIDVIWEKFQARLEPLRQQLNKSLGKKWEEWEIPRDADANWSKEAKDAHTRWWEQRLARQKEIDASIAAKAEFEFLYDKPYDDKKKVRVAGPFTVESLSPHRVLAVGADDELIDPNDSKQRGAEEADFAQMILENLKTAGVQQAHKEDRITFTSLAPWPGRYICAEGKYADADGSEKRAGIFVGPEFGTVSRQDLVIAAREAGDANFDVLIACAFNYEAHASEFNKLGRIPVLKARMNAELHMGAELKNTGKGNLFVIFGEPDIRIFTGGSAELKSEITRREKRIADLEDIEEKIQATKDPVEKVPLVRLLKERDRFKEFLARVTNLVPNDVLVELWGVDVFHPQTGEVRSDDADGIACWFIDTDYNEESFFVRQAYFLGQNDPYKALKTTLKSEINEEAWATLNSDTSRAFPKPKGGKIAVKVINHLGDEVMKVFRIQ